MTDREKLILHLQNLLKKNSKTATVDVKFLLEILNSLPKEQVKDPVVRFDNVSLDLDGGDFSDRE